MRIFTLVLLSCVWLIGCGQADLQQPEQPAPAIEMETAPQVGLQIGNLAPEIEGTDLDGATFRLSDYRGKVVMLDFWGDW